LRRPVTPLWSRALRAAFLKMFGFSLFITGSNYVCRPEKKKTKEQNRKSEKTKNAIF